MKKQQFVKSCKFGNFASLFFLFYLLNFAQPAVCRAQLLVTQEVDLTGNEPTYISLTEDGAPQIIRTSNDYSNYMPSDGIGQPTGSNYTIFCKDKTYHFNVVGQVQFAEKIETALVTEIIKEDEHTCGAYINYYHPLDRLVWKKYLGRQDEDSPGDYWVLSPSGYVVSFSRSEGLLKFIDSKGVIYNAYSILDSTKLTASNNLNFWIDVCMPSDQNGLNQCFSRDGKVFCFVAEIPGSTGERQGTDVLAFNDHGKLIFKNHIPENSPRRLIVSPAGDRVFLALNNLGSPRNTSVVDGYLFTRQGKIGSKRFDGFIPQAIFSESGKYLLLCTRYETLTLIDSKNCKEIREFTSFKNRITNVAIDERSHEIGVVHQLHRSKNKKSDPLLKNDDIKNKNPHYKNRVDDCTVKIISFGDVLIGECVVALPRFGSVSSYPFQFSKYSQLILTFQDRLFKISKVK